MSKEKWTLKNMPDLNKKTIVVTGANSGIGFEAAKAFAMSNALVVMGCRSLERANEARDKIIKEYPEAKLDIILLDLMAFDSIQSFTDSINQKYDKVDVLLNNAGIMTVPYGSTKNGFEKQIGVNHFGHFYLTMNLLKVLNNTKDSRIVSISSIAHRFGNINPNTFMYEENKKYNKSKAYAQSKLANMLFTYGLKSRLEKLGSKISVLAAHPGITSTNLGRHTKSLNFKPVKWLFNKINMETPQGALPGIRACVDPLAKSGEYYGPHKLRGSRGYPVTEKSTKRSHSIELQDLLWEYSENLTLQKLNL